MHKLGRNDPCWCGSGKKYKFCHLWREREDPIPLQEALAAIKRPFKRKLCMHPLAGKNVCSGGIIKAHTIQKNGNLSKIAEKGHVYSCLYLSQESSAHATGPKPALVGVSDASTFPIFCSRHDSEVFAPLERQPFNSSVEQVFLLGYRAVCYELFLKRAQSETRPILSSLDKGKSLAQQVNIQQAIADYMTSVKKAISDLEELKSNYDRILLSGDYSNISFYTIMFSPSPEILCNAVYQPEFDFSGNRVQTLGIPDRLASWIAYSLIATVDGGAATFVWVGSNNVCLSFINSLDALDNAQIPHALVRFTFEFFQNTFLSPPWWDSLDSSVQGTLMKRQMTEKPPQFDLPRRKTCLIDDGIRSVNWEVRGRYTNMPVISNNG